MTDFIELDGSHGEGGGAILRQALALSAITGKAFKIINIRKGRCNSGLAPQHLGCVNAAKDLCNAEVSGHFIGSTEVDFKPSEIKGGRFKINIGTAGSVTLLLQALILPSVFSGKKIFFDIIGGTDVKWSQPFDYFKFVFLPQMKRYADVEANLFKRGYFPRGGGEIKLTIQGKYTLSDDIPAILLIERKKLLQIRGVSHASMDLEDARVSQRQEASAKLQLESLKVPINIKLEYSKSLSTGSGLALWAMYGDEELDFENPIVLGADSLGDKGKKSELVGKEAADNLMKFINSDAAVDPYLADQLIPFMAVAGTGLIKTTEVSKHVKSNIYVAEKFCDVKFTIQDNIITCEKKN
ncbi:MAG: RNA 3'-terminal phosphate cyclase [Nanoarchaeota archaeon]|nr:RNA 3'-terminal phosphate cyclase [Nanoarchaeota archaeon]MBU1321551.1 RNA 3'-terminal phosphate cyclase [Nanoarchaeota archaeon]MBU1597085.1 RNA 3'-terminal phosphate cyclase [Nanoarchaeota archaeon]MBU2441866.1 RNA 3'-terminal phosphate cyclase [Nanoarchaeota archaeon]